MKDKTEYSNVKLQYGLRDNKVIHISDIRSDERGEKCNCICPLCQKNLQARLGTGKRTPHFAHSRENCNIEHAQETALHLLAKEILEENKYILLPEYKVSYMNEEVFFDDSVDYDTLEKQAEPHIEIKETKFSFTDIRLEKRLDGVIPDVLIWYEGTSRKLMIEIAVTHFIDEEKRKKILGQELPCIEIDLSSYHLSEINPEVLKDEVLNQTKNKNWIYNSHHQTAIENINKRNQEYVDDYKRIEEKRQKERMKSEKKRLKKEEEKRVSQIQKLNNIKRSLQPQIYKNIVTSLKDDIAVEKNLRKKDFFQDIKGNYPFYLDIPITGQIAFNCDRRIWQMDLFNNFIYNRKDFTHLSLKWIWTTITSKNKNSYLNWKLITSNKFSLGKKNYEKNLALDAIKTYLQYLALLGFIDINDQFFYPKDYAIVNKTVVPPNLEYAIIFQEIVSTLEDTPLIDSDILNSL